MWKLQTLTIKVYEDIRADFQIGIRRNRQEEGQPEHKPADEEKDSSSSSPWSVSQTSSEVEDVGPDIASGQASTDQVSARHGADIHQVSARHNATSRAPTLASAIYNLRSSIWIYDSVVAY